MKRDKDPLPKNFTSHSCPSKKLRRIRFYNILKYETLEFGRGDFSRMRSEDEIFKKSKVFLPKILKENVGLTDKTLLYRLT